MPQRLGPLPRDVRYAELATGLGDVLGALGAGLGRRREEKRQEQLTLQQQERQQEAWQEEGIPEYLWGDQDGIKQWRSQKGLEAKEQRALTTKQKELGTKSVEERQEREAVYNSLVRDYGADANSARRISDLPKQQRKSEYDAYVKSWVPPFARRMFTGSGAAPEEQAAMQQQAMMPGQQQMMPQQQQPTAGLPSELLRQATGVGVSGLTGLAGVPGNILALGQSLGQMLPWQQKPQPTQAELEQMPELMRQQIESSQNQLGLLPLPTTENLRSLAEKALPEDYIKPKNRSDQFMQEVATDIGSLLFPMPGSSAKIGQKLLKAGATAGLGNISKVAAQNVGANPFTQESLKLGTMLLTGFGMEKQLRARASQMQEAAKNLAKDKTVSSNPIQKILGKAQDFVLAGAEEAPDRAEVQRAINAIGKRVDTNKIPLETLIELKRDVGTFASEAKFTKSKQVLGELRKNLDSFLKTSDMVPKNFSKTLYDADKVYSAIKAGDKINNTIYNAFKGSRGLAPLSAVMYPARMAKALAIGVPAYAGARTVNFMKNIFTNAPMRKEYIKLMRAGMKENTPVIVRQARRLSEEANKRYRAK